MKCSTSKSKYIGRYFTDYMSPFQIFKVISYNKYMCYNRNHYGIEVIFKYYGQTKWTKGYFNTNRKHLNQLKELSEQEVFMEIL